MAQNKCIERKRYNFDAKNTLVGRVYPSWACPTRVHALIFISFTILIDGWWWYYGWNTNPVHESSILYHSNPYLKLDELHIVDYRSPISCKCDLHHIWQITHLEMTRIYSKTFWYHFRSIYPWVETICTLHFKKVPPPN